MQSPALAKTIVEPVFGQMQTVQGARQLLLRGEAKARAQWRFHCAVHNLLKLHRAGGLDLIREHDAASARPVADKRSRLPSLTTAAHALAAGFRRTLAAISLDRSVRIASIALTDPGS